MKRDLSLWQFGGFAFTALFGTLLHYLYDWFGQSLWIAPFSGVNESTWEHMKLLYFPLLLFALLQSRFFTGYPNFWCVKLWGTVTGLFLIPVLFYTCNGAFGKTPDWFNISIFFIADAAVYLLETRLLRQGKPRCARSRLAWLLLWAPCVLFLLFTFLPPKLPLFQDPLNGSFGVL